MFDEEEYFCEVCLDAQTMECEDCGGSGYGVLEREHPSQCNGCGGTGQTECSAC